MRIVISTVFVILLVSIAQAGIFTTSPISSTVWKAETAQTITWINAKTPPLAQLTNVKIDLMTGPEDKNIFLMTIGSGVKGTDLKFVFKKGVPKNLGPSGQFYFLKFTDGDFAAFSARFTINGIDGTIAGFDPNNPNGNNSTAGNSTGTDPYGNGGSTGGSTGGDSSGGSSGSSTSSTSSTTATGTSSGSKPNNTNKAAAGSASSLSTVHVATFVIALVGMVISNWM